MTENRLAAKLEVPANQLAEAQPEHAMRYWSKDIAGALGVPLDETFTQLCSRIPSGGHHGFTVVRQNLPRPSALPPGEMP
jgi:hypothetical protein